LRHRCGPSKECWQQVKPAPLSWRLPEPRSPMPAAASLDPAVPALSVDYVAAPAPGGLLAADDVLAVFGFGDPAPAHGGDPRYLRVPLQPHAGPAPYEVWRTGRRGARGRGGERDWSTDGAPARGGLLAADCVLAVFGFGDPAPAHGGDPRYLRVPLQPHAGPAPYEVWRTGRRVASGRDGEIAWSSDGALSFGVIEVDERAYAC